MTSIDLFSGCGGMTLGFKMAGFNSIFASDVDENAGKTFIRNFPNTPFKVADICQITKEDVDEVTGGIIPDVIIGGPPCQGFSLANKRRGSIKDDPRNRLFYQFVNMLNHQALMFLQTTHSFIVLFLINTIWKTIVYLVFPD